MTTVLLKNGRKIPRSSLKFSISSRDSYNRLEISYDGVIPSRDVAGVSTVLNKNLEISVPAIKYPANLMFTDLVSVNSFSVSLKLSVGDTLKLTPRGGGYGGGRSDITDLIPSLNSLKVSVDSKSIIWSQLILYLIALAIIDAIIYYLLPRLGYGSDNEKIDIQNIQKTIDYFKYDLISERSRPKNFTIDLL